MKTTAGYIPDFFIYIYLLQTSRLFVNYANQQLAF